MADYSLKLVLTLSLWMIPYAGAQQPYHFEIGGGPGFPKGDSARFAGVSGNFVAGGGVTLVPHVALLGEYMFQDLPVKRDVISRLRIPDASAHLHAITGNVQVAFGTHALSGYAIGGGGWYRRSWKITRPSLGTETECDLGLLWFGIFDCHDEIDLSTRTVVSDSDTAAGWNGGGGVMIGLGRETNAKLFAEVRYHRAYHRGINTEVLPITFGIRW